VEGAGGAAPSSGAAPGPSVKGLHHAAFRCRDSEETRRFYEGFLGLPLVEAFEIRQTKTGRSTSVLHTFFEMGDGSCMAFFEAPGRPFDFKVQHDFDLHIALEVEPADLEAKFEEGKALGIETRGIADHGFIRSIYFRDPNGYVVELSAKKADDAAAIGAGDRTRAARAALDEWQSSKPGDARPDQTGP
jgi:catechol 2,3-dioxygenase-like lactoylglutathione lyase family enzyme